MSFNLGNVLKKATSVAVNTAAGFVGGGPVGAGAGFARGIYENTKTGRAETINLRTFGQAAVTGGVANVAAGLAVKAGSSVASNGGIAKTIAGFGKSGGVSGGIVHAFSGIASYAAKGLPVLAGLAKSGVTPGTSDTPTDALQTVQDRIDRAQGYYRGLRQNVPAVGNLADNIRDKAVGFAKNAVDQGAGSLLSGQAPVSVNVGGPDTGAASGGTTPLFFLAGGIVLLMFFLFKKH